MFTIGTSLYAASSSKTASAPVRIPTAATWRESTSAVSRGASPRESCSSSARSTTAWPPSSSMPTSNDTRVRVEGFSKINATLRPDSACEERGARFSSSARSSSASSSGAVSSAPVMKWRGVMESASVGAGRRLVRDDR